MSFEAYVDPNSGEWIRITEEAAKDVVWRPADIGLDENGQFKFSEVVQLMIQTIMTHMLAKEKAEVEMMAEDQMQEVTDEKAKDSTLSQDIAKSKFFEGQNAHKVSEAMLPQDVQSDLAEISAVLGGLKPE
jgi:hypothetical protein